MNYKQPFLYFISFLLLWAGLTPKNAVAQSQPDKVRETYLTPPEKILDQVLAPRYKNIFLDQLSPDNKFYVNYIKDDNLTPIALYARPFYNLGGLEIDPVANRKMEITNHTLNASESDFGMGLLLTNATTGERQTIKLPPNTYASHVKWAPDGTKLAYFVHSDKKTDIYVYDIKAKKSEKITERSVLATMNTDFDWTSDGKSIFTVLVPNNRGAEPEMPEVKQPQVRMSSSRENRMRTNLYLLENQYQVALLKYFITGQYARINVSNHKINEIGTPQMISNIDVSPDGKFTIVRLVDTPFSYIAPVKNFGWTEVIWDSDGNVLTKLQKRKPRLGIPNQVTYQYRDRKDFKWRPDGQGLSMIDAIKIKGSKKKKYRVVKWMSPFKKADKEVVYESDSSLNNVYYDDQGKWLFLRQASNGRVRMTAVQPSKPNKSYLIFSHKIANIRVQPGNLVMKKNKLGEPVVLLTSDKNSIYLKGMRYDKDPLKNGPKSFLDRKNILSKKKKRVFESSNDGVFVQIKDILDADARNIVISRESAKEFPNFWNLDPASGNEKKLTDNRDYNKEITNAVQKRFKVKRADNFEFWITVMLPENWNGKPLPGLIWHYPREYVNQKAYDNTTGKFNINKFPIINQGWPERTAQLLIQDGYAVVQADWPIYAPRGESNDAFVYNLQQNSTAIIDSIVSKGLVKRDQIAIGGHSYGGFGTINALIHTSFFKAGIAGDANSNRLLTPVGFQHEKRDLWRARSTYAEMSPILWANQLDGALLMYSGEDDQNVGTSPFMSWQLFHALNALGKTVALYMYPYAQHHTNAKEIVLDRWTRWVEWLDHYVKNNGKPIPENELGVGE